jgi:hypothetical protein
MGVDQVDITDHEASANLLGLDDKPILPEARAHYSEHRFTCPNVRCGVNFCRACRISPYARCPIFDFTGNCYFAHDFCFVKQTALGILMH